MKAFDFIEALNSGKFVEDAKHEFIIHQEKDDTITIYGSVVSIGGIKADALAISGEYIAEVFTGIKRPKNHISIHTEDFEVMKK